MTKMYNRDGQTNRTTARCWRNSQRLVTQAIWKQVKDANLSARTGVAASQGSFGHQTLLQSPAAKL